MLIQNTKNILFSSLHYNIEKARECHAELDSAPSVFKNGFKALDSEINSE